MSNDINKKSAWNEIAVKTFTSVIVAILIAWAGFISNMTLSSIESKKENARLITELQVKREQAENDLRKDIFDQALKTLFSENSEIAGLRSQSKRMLRLELLSLNFGDSLSLSPLFTEFKNDLDQAEPVNDEDTIDHSGRVAVLKKRLQTLAKKVASAQLSSVSQHGISITVNVPLVGIKHDSPCGHKFYNVDSYKWPDDFVRKQLVNTEGQLDDGDISLFNSMKDDLSIVTINNVSRKVTMTFSQVDHCSKTVLVNFEIIKLNKNGQDSRSGFSSSVNNKKNEIVSRNFELDFFNFPKVDNTRLSDNHRFAIVLEQFKPGSNKPYLEVTSVIFPAEYSSLRDRPGMREALELLQSVTQENQE